MPAFARFATALLIVSAFRVEAAPARDQVPVERLPYIFDIAVDRADSSRVLLATRGGLYRAGADGLAALLSPDLRSLRSISFRHHEPGIVYAAGVPDPRRGRDLLVSRDGGHRWGELPRDPSGGPRSVRIVEVSKADPSVLYVAGHRLWVSGDGARSWTEVAVPPSRIIDLAASALEPNTVYAATRAGLMRSRDGGRSWAPAFATARCRQPTTAVATGNDGVVYAFSLCSGLLRGDERTGAWQVANDRFGGCVIQHLAVDPADSARLVAVVRCSKVVASVDGGVTWRELGASTVWQPGCLPDEPIL